MAREVEQEELGSSREVVRTTKIYGDKDGKDDWTEAELSKVTYLVKELLAIPGVGSWGGVFVENQWLSWVTGCVDFDCDGTVGEIGKKKRLKSRAFSGKDVWSVYVISLIVCSFGYQHK